MKLRITALISLALAFLAAATFSTGMIDPDHGDFVATVSFITSMTVMIFTALRTEGTPFSPYVLFLMTTCLFVGGRFFAHAMGAPYPIFEDTGFQPISLSNPEKMRLMALVLTCLLAIHAGYVGIRPTRPLNQVRNRTMFHETLWIPAGALIALGFLIAAIGYISDATTVFQEGYVALYDPSADPTGRLLTAGQYALLLGTGISFATSKSRLQLAGVLLYGVIQAGTLALGVRTGFLSFVLLAVWLFHTRIRPIRARYFVILPLFLLVLVQVVATYSARNDVAANLPSVSGKPVADPDTWDRLRHFTTGLTPVYLRYFAWSQGTSLLSIDVAASVENYPLPAYLQTFIPGFGVAANLAGAGYTPDQLYFGQHMAKEWMPDLYAQGYGFGWSVVSDMIVFGQNNVALIMVFSTTFGAALGWLYKANIASPIGLAVAVTIFPKLMVLPRAGLYSIFPYMFALLFLVVGWWLLLHTLRSLKAIRPRPA